MRFVQKKSQSFQEGQQKHFTFFHKSCLIYKNGFRVEQWR